MQDLQLPDGYVQDGDGAGVGGKGVHALAEGLDERQRLDVVGAHFDAEYRYKVDQYKAVELCVTRGVYWIEVRGMPTCELGVLATRVSGAVGTLESTVDRGPA